MSNEKKGRSDGLLKDGTSRLAKGTGGKGMPKIMWVALVVIVGGAVLLFRQPGGDMPTGIGERRSVVTVGADSAGHDPAPRSGDVDIAAQTRELTPEQPADASVDQPAATTVPPPAQETKPKPEPAEAAAREPAPAEEKILPRTDGRWVVQVGSFGTPANADKEAARLQGLGWNAQVKVGNRSDGSMIYRVRIGNFTSREDAETFARQNKQALPGAIAVHR